MRAKRVRCWRKTQPYLCGCGWWHLGTKGKQVTRGEMSRAEAYGDRTKAAA